MKINLYKTKFFISFLSLVFLSSFSLAAETFRVSKMHIATIQAETESEASASLGINESLAIFIPEDKTFLEGLEVKMEIPDTIAAWMDSVACSVYDNVNPVPSTSQIDYSATRQYVSTLPGRLSWVLQIPVKADNSIKANRYTTKMENIPDVSKNFVFIRLQPVMKGIPEEALKSKINITIKPILSDKGQLELNLNSPNEDKFYTDKTCTVYIDDQIVNLTKKNNKILLSTGVHNISIISDEFRNEVRTVRIAQAKKSVLDINMHSIEPTLLINAPEGTKVYLDDEPCKIIGKEFAISEGDHKIRFQIGDYEILRTISVNKGKVYKANCAVDLEISEE